MFFQLPSLPDTQEARVQSPPLIECFGQWQTDITMVRLKKMKQKRENWGKNNSAQTNRNNNHGDLEIISLYHNNNFILLISTYYYNNHILIYLKGKTKRNFKMKSYLLFDFRETVKRDVLTKVGFKTMNCLERFASTI